MIHVSYNILLENSVQQQQQYTQVPSCRARACLAFSGIAPRIPHPLHPAARAAVRAPDAVIAPPFIVDPVSVSEFPKELT